MEISFRISGTNEMGWVLERQTRPNCAILRHHTNYWISANISTTTATDHPPSDIRYCCLCLFLCHWIKLFAVKVSRSGWVLDKVRKWLDLETYIYKRTTCQFKEVYSSPFLVWVTVCESIMPVSCHIWFRNEETIAFISYKFLRQHQHHDHHHHKSSSLSSLPSSCSSSCTAVPARLDRDRYFMRGLTLPSNQPFKSKLENPSLDFKTTFQLNNGQFIF